MTHQNRLPKDVKSLALAFKQWPVKATCPSVGDSPAASADLTLATGPEHQV